MQLQLTDEGEHRPIFDSGWPQWLGLAVVNLLLTIITLGIYRFWARTRERRYLWSATRWGGEPLEYTGKGQELLIGALLAFLILVLPVSLAGMGGAVAQGLGMAAVGLAINLAVYAIFLWLYHIAVWRALRYRLSRTRWSGIRGAMDGSSLAYALIGMKMLLLSVVTLGFATPYASVRLFNARWSDARLGTMKVRVAAQWRPLMRSYLASWGISLLVLAGAAASVWAQLPPDVLNDPSKAVIAPQTIVTILTSYLIAGLIVALLMLRYYAAQWRALVGGVSIEGLHFGFGAGAGDWLRYWLGNAALVVFTLGVGLLMLPWRKWRFLTAHLRAEGGLDLERLAQTRIEAPVYGEGLADVLDMGAL